MNVSAFGLGYVGCMMAPLLSAITPATECQVARGVEMLTDLMRGGVCKWGGRPWETAASIAS